MEQKNELFAIFRAVMVGTDDRKIVKNQSHLVKFGCGNPRILVTFLTGQEFLRKPPHFQYI